ncbi:ABC transporter ATP-binding protein [Sporolactobacillus shoreae]|uniref:ABC transporter ATP-binding protein n=1 Tax=Sporolactobacillus shoreae TaxID=1465501 RepID=A0A4Z0GL72_9BACL|nr:ABC transporter ATP-binding protein [Sporolactobacillus shoreae]TGA97675.1 ABC transporter ATP-binding protein [Sporolactobacillus shoreae]
MYQLMRLVSGRTVWLNFICKLINKLIFLCFPIVEMQLIDALVQRNLSGILFYTWISVLFFFLSQGSNYVVDLADGYATKEAWISIYTRLDQKLRNLDIRHSDLTDGSLQQFMGQNYELVKQFITNVPITIIINALYIVGIICCMLTISFPITLVVVIAMPVFLLFSQRFEKRMTVNAKRNVEDMEQMKDYESDQFHLTKEERFLKDKQLPPVNHFFVSYITHMKKKIRTEAIFDNILSYGMLNAIILIGTLMSAFFVYRGNMTIGALSAIQLYTSRFWDPAEFFATIRKQYLSTKPIIESFNHMLNLPVIDFHRESIQSLEIKNYISLDSDGKELHSAISHVFQRGAVSLIRGDNGAGKTTLIESILGLCSRYKGEILINHRPVNRQLADIVYIPADPYISTHGVLSYKNGSYGQKKLTQIRHDLQTDKSVYFFDEPTNFLDTANKESVIRLINDLAEKDKIVIVISHDPFFEDLGNKSELVVSKTDKW